VTAVHVSQDTVAVRVATGTRHGVGSKEKGKLLQKEPLKYHCSAYSLLRAVVIKLNFGITPDFQLILSGLGCENLIRLLKSMCKILNWLGIKFTVVMFHIDLLTELFDEIALEWYFDSSWNGQMVSSIGL
jgi:hypothetical protein